jgi:hypothetical protein
VKTISVGTIDRASLGLRAQLRLDLKTETVSGLRKVVFYIKERTMDYVVNCDSCKKNARTFLNKSL